MAEFLIFAKPHWLDAPGEYEKQMVLIETIPGLTPEQIIKKKEALAAKYAARYRPGDIIDVQADGYYGEPEEKDKHGWNHKAFALIKVPGLQFRVAEQYTVSLEDLTDPTNPLVLVKRRYSVVLLGLSPGETRIISKLKDMAITDKNG